MKFMSHTRVVSGGTSRNNEGMQRVCSPGGGAGAGGSVCRLFNQKAWRWTALAPAFAESAIPPPTYSE